MYHYKGVFDVYLDFALPVNNLTFNILNFRNSYDQPAVYIDVYVHQFYYGTFYVYGNFGQGTIPVTLLRNIADITDIRMYYPYNLDQFNQFIPLYYDDFTFTPDLDVNITNARVSGILNGTTQNALVGGDIALNASAVPSGTTGGNYSWTFTGPYTLVGGATNSSSVTIRSTDVGTLTANVTYTKNGFTASRTLTINALLPTLSSFTAQEAAERVARNACGGDLPPPTSFYVLGCPTGLQGITFSAQAMIPAGNYLTDPAQSGIKYVQIINSLRKELQAGSVKCSTARAQESDTQNGWQLDTADPSNAPGYPIRRFSEGNVLSMPDVDSPRAALELISVYTNLDALYVDEVFETYVFYFVGSPDLPTFQRAIGLQNSGSPVSRIAWGWGGLVVYDPAAPSAYRIVSSRTIPGSYSAQSVNSVRSYAGNVRDLDPNYARCPSGPDLTTNLIDGSRFFVRQQYCDIYSREPDQGGWDYWTGQITSCGFDLSCIYSAYGRRSAVAAAFFYEAEAQRVDPDLANPPGSAGFNPSVYNPAFVRHCYLNFLRRHPEQGGLDFWVDVLNRTGDYLGVINAFTSYPEYRDRGFRKDICVTPIS